MHTEDQEQQQPTKKPRAPRKPKAVDTPPVPGTDASEPPDLLGAIPDVEAELSEAEAILAGEKKPMLNGGAIRSEQEESPLPRTAARLALGSGDIDLYNSEDRDEFLNSLFEINAAYEYPAELTSLLQGIDQIATKHAAAALKAGKRSIANDFNALNGMARQIAKKAAGVNYWRVS